MATFPSYATILQSGYTENRGIGAVATDIADGRGGIPSALQSAYGLNRAAGGF